MNFFILKVEFGDEKEENKDKDHTKRVRKMRIRDVKHSEVIKGERDKSGIKEKSRMSTNI